VKSFDGMEFGVSLAQGARHRQPVGGEFLICGKLAVFRVFDTISECATSWSFSFTSSLHLPC
jgi:hypothetical protein